MLKTDFALDEIEPLQASFEEASPQDILRWATCTFGEKLTVVTSFQPTGIVTLHMLQAIAPQTQVFTLDTGLLFHETYDLIDRIEERLQLNLKRLKPEQSVAQQATRYGANLWERQPDFCCHLRKTQPLQSALVDFDAWITGLRRDQSPERADTPIISEDRRYGMIKIAPFATWTEDMIWTYIEAYDLPYNELHDFNYPSIGCMTCTSPVMDGDDPRGGRWANKKKTECGIHVDLVSSESSEEQG